MHSRLPPLNALRALEAAARHLSFRKAADELHVTPAAVSHQIKALEDYLDVRLFHRLTRGLELTPAAEASLARLREGFAALAAAAEQMRAGSALRTVSVGVPPSLAAKWLVPRLHRFVSAHPELDVRIAAGEEFIDRRRELAARHVERASHAADGVDLAIRCGWGDYQGTRVERLLGISATPLCSPRLLAGEHALGQLVDLRHHTLLHDETIGVDDGGADWGAWLRAAGVEGVDATRGQRFNHAALALDAAIDGRGVVLSYPVLAASEIEAGLLVAPFELDIPLDIAYHLVRHDVVAESPAVAAFAQWLMEEAQATHSGERSDEPRRARAQRQVA